MIHSRTHETFSAFLSQLQETNATLSYYTDFEKCLSNVKAIAIKLHQLNYLLGKTDLDNAVQDLWNEHPKVFSVLGILIATRNQDSKKVLETDNNIRLLTDFFTSPDGVIRFIEETGLKTVFQNKNVTNLVDFVFGVEVGLDSNARKNRCGALMEARIRSAFQKANLKFLNEVFSTNYLAINEALGEDIKRFDFAIETRKKTFLVEVNFYNNHGSKLNEVARAYTELAPKINNTPGFEFVWITDGIGWLSAKNKLEEAYYTIPHIYNLQTLPLFVEYIQKL